MAVARRAGVADELLDWVRLAVGDACGRAVARHVRYGVDELIQVIMSDDGPYEVRVIDACGTDIAEEPQVAAEDPAVAEDADRMGETLLAGLVEDLRSTPARGHRGADGLAGPQASYRRPPGHDMAVGRTHILYHADKQPGMTALP